MDQSRKAAVGCHENGQIDPDPGLARRRQRTADQAAVDGADDVGLLRGEFAERALVQADLDQLTTCGDSDVGAVAPAVEQVDDRAASGPASLLTAAASTCASSR